MRASPSISTFAPGGCAQRALPGLQVHRHLRIGSPDRCAASPPGNSATLRSVPGGGAQRALPGLQVQCRLRAGSPDRCAASPPGNSATLHSVPGGGAQRALPGLQVQCRLRAGSPDRCAQPFLVADTFSGSRMTGTPTTALSGAVVFSQGTLLRYQQLML